MALNMKHEEKVHWRYEWPLKRKVIWHVQKLLTQSQQQVLKRWLRHVENINDEGKRYDRYLIDLQVGNDKRSFDLINCQVGIRETPIFQVGKGEEMNSTDILYQ